MSWARGLPWLLVKECHLQSSAPPTETEMDFGGREKIKELEENLPKVLPRICSLLMCKEDQCVSAEMTRLAQVHAT